MALLRTDKELLRRFKAGDRRALEKVYWAYMRRVDAQIRAVVRRFNADELLQASVVADLVQDTFLKAFSAQARGAYDGQRDYAPYLATIARNCVVDALRKRGREVLTPPAELVLADQRQDELEQRYDVDVVAVLQEYVANLPSELTGVYQQRFVLGQSQQRACEVLGLSRSNLRTREAHLRKGLRHALQSAGVLFENESSASAKHIARVGSS